jgi:SAM-dependent methyltransferase
MDSNVAEKHRKVWNRKPTLRRVYRTYFRQILRLCGPHRPILEIGCGPGMFRECYPEVLATDVTPSQWTSVVCDGCRLPFADRTIGNIVLIDVFHHLGDPLGMLRGAARVLKTGGRIIMLEPWTSALGYLFYRFVHHESANYRIDVLRPFPEGKDSLDGNAVLPRVYFDHWPTMGGPLHDLGLQLRRVQPLSAVNWLLTGGFQDYGVRSRVSAPWLDALDAVFRPFSTWMALRAFIVIEKTAR